MKKIDYEVIFVLVNRGFTETVMDAAKKEGARGGTIINCRGSANDKAEKSYGVVITPEKVLILIIVESDIKEKVINAIYKVAGIETKAMGLICSSPISNVVGIKHPWQEELIDEAEKVEKKVAKKNKK